jgi:hypothetical protein
MPTADELRELCDRRRGRETDRRNTRRRDRYREQNQRWCECGAEITGTKLQRCDACTAKLHQRVCAAPGCDIPVSDRRLRCPGDEILHQDELRDRRNERRRAGRVIERGCA